jgi:hypothetical protein
MQRRSLLVMLTTALAVVWLACGDDDTSSNPGADAGPLPTSDGGPLPDGNVPKPDGGDASGPRTSCIERPNELPRPPTGNRLPCELIPPGLTLAP